MKRKELYILKDAIEDCGNLSNLEFIHRIAIIYNDIIKHLEIFEKHRPSVNPEYTKYIEKRTFILDTYAAKNENGTYITSKQGVVIANATGYTNDISALEKEYEKIISQHKKDNFEFDKFLDSDFDFKFNLIPKKFIPTNITFNQYIGINSLIETDPPLKKK